jgi:hypothetical protein
MNLEGVLDGLINVQKVSAAPMARDDGPFDRESTIESHRSVTSVYSGKIVSEINEIVSADINVNAEINKLEAYFKSQRCPHCSKIVKEYEYGLKIINELRAEEAELQEMIDEDIGEDKYSVVKFMSKHYATMERFPLKDVAKKYKDVVGVTITLSDLRKSLEESGLFKVSNVHNAYFVTRK